MQKLLEKAKSIECVILDVDGVMTDGSLFMGDDGQEYKAFNSLDGHGLRMLQESGITVAIITGRKSNVVNHRMNDLGITTIYQGYRDKTPAYEELLKDKNLNDNQIAYVGDDVVDLPVMSRVGFSIAVQNAHPFVKKHADWTTEASGGRGAVREVCELFLNSRGLLDGILESYLYKS